MYAAIQNFIDLFDRLAFVKGKMLEHLLCHQIQFPLTDCLDLAADVQIKPMFLQVANAGFSGAAVALEAVNYSTVTIYAPLELDKSGTTVAAQLCRPDGFRRMDSPFFGFFALFH